MHNNVIFEILIVDITILCDVTLLLFCKCNNFPDCMLHALLFWSDNWKVTTSDNDHNNDYLNVFCGFPWTPRQMLETN
jgi:hypothetical protein